MKHALFGSQRWRSKTISWSGTDSEERFKQHLENPDTAQQLKNLGFAEPNCITYKYNSCGFRTDEFDNRPAGLALGCSFTEGTGLPLDASWPAQLSKLIGQHIWNLGVHGSALDSAYNFLDHYIAELNIKFVVLCVPPINRFEFFSKNTPKRIVASRPESHDIYGSFFKEWFSTEQNSLTNRSKNLLAMEQLCRNYNVPFYYLLAEEYLPNDQLARDLSHAGVDKNRDFALKMYNKITKRESP